MFHTFFTLHIIPFTHAYIMFKHNASFSYNSYYIRDHISMYIFNHICVILLTDQIPFCPMNSSCIYPYTCYHSIFLSITYLLYDTHYFYTYIAYYQIYIILSLHYTTILTSLRCWHEFSSLLNKRINCFTCSHIHIALTSHTIIIIIIVSLIASHT